jgi:hypothetical protein
MATCSEKTDAVDGSLNKISQKKSIQERKTLFCCIAVYYVDSKYFERNRNL